MLIIPIRTESEIRRTPVVNYVLLGANVFLFLVLDQVLSGEAISSFKMRHLALHSDEPALHQFFTYQFLHADLWHLLGNMLFLWVFGNSVNAKMGDIPYLLFYVAGGVFAAWGYCWVTPQPSQLVGASGAIAAVTTAYLALFPRSRVTVLVWLFIFIHFFEVPAMILIGLKIIVWDNVIAPSLGGQGGIAHSAHLAGYFYGFAGALGMLFIRALPRDQFDILALWSRWKRRREFASAMSEPGAAVRAQYGSVARIGSPDAKQQAIDARRFDEISDLRTRISDRLEQRDAEGAAVLYTQLLEADSRQCLSQHHQLQIARHFYGVERFLEAAAAFERYIECYPHSIESGEVQLLLGIVYARDLHQYEVADKHLTSSLKRLRDEARRGQCFQWLSNVRSALGRPAPES